MRRWCGSNPPPPGGPAGDPGDPGGRTAHPAPFQLKGAQVLPTLPLIIDWFSLLFSVTILPSLRSLGVVIKQLIRDREVIKLLSHL